DHPAHLLLRPALRAEAGRFSGDDPVADPRLLGAPPDEGQMAAFLARGLRGLTRRHCLPLHDVAAASPVGRPDYAGLVFPDRATFAQILPGGFRDQRRLRLDPYLALLDRRSGPRRRRALQADLP